MNSSCIPFLAAQAAIVPLMYSGPLSQRIRLGLPRYSIRWFSVLRMTRSADMEKSTSIPIAVIQYIQ